MYVIYKLFYGCPKTKYTREKQTVKVALCNLPFVTQNKTKKYMRIICKIVYTICLLFYI